jgi:nucleoside-diphosphate-sugar epimerase
VKILVTGANGFVGQALCKYHSKTSMDQVVAAVRRRGQVPGDITQKIVGDISGHTSWHEALDGVDAVAHLAGRAHVMRDTSADPLSAYQAVNTEGTLNLASQAAEAGVKRLVFLSSIKVCGEGQSRVSDDAYTERQSCSPSDPYAVSKHEAELGLREIARTTGLEVTILRPPLVYGPGVGANFLRLMQAVNRGWPLPFGGIDNRRDLIFLGNLVNAITLCTKHPAAANKTFLLADGEGLSTPALIRRIGAALNRPARLITVPPDWLHFAAGLAGKRMAIERLLGSLMVDSRAIRRDLAWQPPYSIEEGLAATADWFRQQQTKE